MSKSTYRLRHSFTAYVITLFTLLLRFSALRFRPYVRSSGISKTDVLFIFYLRNYLENLQGVIILLVEPPFSWKLNLKVHQAQVHITPWQLSHCWCHENLGIKKWGHSPEKVEEAWTTCQPDLQRRAEWEKISPPTCPSKLHLNLNL